jgi:hypothetical protein
MFLKSIYILLTASLFLGCGSTKEIDKLNEARENLVGSWDRVCVRDAEKNNSFRDLLTFDKKKSMLTVERTTYSDLRCTGSEVDHDKLEAIYLLTLSDNKYKEYTNYELMFTPLADYLFLEYLLELPILEKVYTQIYFDEKEHLHIASGDDAHNASSHEDMAVAYDTTSDYVKR